MSTSAKQIGKSRSDGLERVHSLIVNELPELTGDIEACASAQRKIAESLMNQEDASLFAPYYLRNQVSKRYQHGSIKASERLTTAVSGFLEAESNCRDMNAKLVDGWNKPWPEETRALLMKARRWIKSVLGPFPWEQFPRACAFSSGATTEFARDRAFLQNKWDKGSHTTADALPYCLTYVRWWNNNSAAVVLDDELDLQQVDPCIQHWQKRFEIVDGNVVFTVVKNYAKDRLAAKEPTWNVFLQRGVGLLVKHRLQRVGLLHRDSSDYASDLACLASRLGHLATIDLSAASDSISLALCELLFEDDWLQVLLDLRSPTGRLPDGSTIVYEKISSMGNGYTFEIETLIFAALAQAVCGGMRSVSVYGDDIIIPSEHYQRLVDLLTFVGFATNVEKTFHTGFFRESCGGHFFNGVDVKPFYIESLPTCLPECVELHNQIVAYAGRHPVTPGWREVVSAIRKLVPRAYWGPYGVPGCLWAAWDQTRPRISRPLKGDRRDTQQPPSWKLKAFVKRVPSQVHDYLEGSLYLALNSSSCLPQGDKGGSSTWRVSRSHKPTVARLFALQCVQREQQAERDASEIDFPKSASWSTRTTYVSVYTQWTNPPL